MIDEKLLITVVNSPWTMGILLIIMFLTWRRAMKKWQD